MHVILVEDDPSTLALLEKNIAKWGHAVTTAANGLEALEAVRNGSFDIIVSDWIMPQMNGLELCEAIRNLDLPHYVYIVLISAPGYPHGRGAGTGRRRGRLYRQALEHERITGTTGDRRTGHRSGTGTEFRSIWPSSAIFTRTVRLFVRFLETYDRNLGGHSRRVGRVALELAGRTPCVSPEDYPIIETAGFLHDIGLIGLPRSVMTKSIVRT